MPSNFSHIYLARRVADYLQAQHVADWTPPPTDHSQKFGYQPDYCGKIMDRWKKFTAVGAIGHDLFYYSQDYASQIKDSGALAPGDEIMLALSVYYAYRTDRHQEWEPLLLILDKVNSSMAAIIRFMLKLDKMWDDFMQVWSNTLDLHVRLPGVSANALTGDTLGQLKQALNQLGNGLRELIKTQVFTAHDFYSFLNTCVAKGWDEQSFTWADMLHYRRTTKIVRNLIMQAESLRAENEERCEQLLALAFGWMTHVGGDVIGHSFVNTQCGGTFRNHPQRHGLIEKHIDAWNYQQSRSGGAIPSDDLGASPLYPTLTSSGMVFAVHMANEQPHGAHGATRPSSLPPGMAEQRKALRMDGELPLWTAEAITKAMIATYYDEPSDGDRPTYPKVFKGSVFQAGIDENYLAEVFRTIFGTEPTQMLIDKAAPKPSFDVPEGFPLPWQIQVCYRLMLTVYNLSYNASWRMEKPPKPDVIILPPGKHVDDLFEPPDFSGASSGDVLDDICSSLKALNDWVQKQIDAVNQLIDDLITMVNSPASYGFRLALYKAAMAIWDIISKIHRVLSHTGWAVPNGEVRYSDGELRLADEIDRQLITLGGSADAAFKQALNDVLDPMGNLDKNPDLITGHPVPDKERYPLFQVVSYKDNGISPTWDSHGRPEPQEFRRPWAYPIHSLNGRDNVDTPTERLDGRDGPTIAGPFPAGTMPDHVFFRTDLVGDPRVRHLYEKSGTPQATERLNEQHLPSQEGGPLGGLVPFSAYLIGRISNDSTYRTQFNLDADRAYGYLTWDWIRSYKVARADLPAVTYKLPQTPPQGAKGKVWEPLKRVEMEYIDEPPETVPTREFPRPPRVIGRAKVTEDDDD